MPRQYDKYTYTDFGMCARCKRTFTYTFSTRRPKYCLECGPIVNAEKAELRRVAYRERQKQNKKQAAKRGNGKRGASPSLLGGVKGAETLSRAPLRGGMFADMPIGEANERRARLGLPALAH